MRSTNSCARTASANWVNGHDAGVDVLVTGASGGIGAVLDLTGAR
jgi:hypothetical protein